MTQCTEKLAESLSSLQKKVEIKPCFFFILTYRGSEGSCYAFNLKQQDPERKLTVAKLDVQNSQYAAQKLYFIQVFFAKPLKLVLMLS